MTVDGVEVFKSKYDIVKYIGKGGFSTVHLCRHKLSGVEYAVKVWYCPQTTFQQPYYIPSHVGCRLKSASYEGEIQPISPTT